MAKDRKGGAKSGKPTPVPVKSGGISKPAHKVTNDAVTKIEASPAKKKKTAPKFKAAGKSPASNGAAASAPAGNVKKTELDRLGKPWHGDPAPAGKAAVKEKATAGVEKKAADSPADPPQKPANKSAVRPVAKGHWDTETGEARKGGSAAAGAGGGGSKNGAAVPAGTGRQHAAGPLQKRQQADAARAKQRARDQREASAGQKEPEGETGKAAAAKGKGKKAAATAAAATAAAATAAAAAAAAAAEAQPRAAKATAQEKGKQPASETAPPRGTKSKAERGAATAAAAAGAGAAAAATGAAAAGSDDEGAAGSGEDEENSDGEPATGGRGAHGRGRGRGRGGASQGRGRGKPGGEAEGEEGRAGPSAAGQSAGPSRRRGGPVDFSALGLPSEDRLRVLLDNLKPDHVAEREKLFQSHCAEFPRWRLALVENFSLLVCGIGSKRLLLEKFAMSTLVVVRINGYMKGATVVRILETALQGLLPDDALPQPQAAATSAAHHHVTGGGGRAVDALMRRIKAELEGGGRRLFVLIHNIDGRALRGASAQEALADLAALERCHVVATVDHANAAMLWSPKLLARFDWKWEVAHTYEPYKEEAADLPFPLSVRTEQRVLQSALQVLKHVTKNARETMAIIIEHQLQQEERGDAAKGIPTDELFAKCKQNWVVNNLDTLKTFVKEFRDHDLIRVHKAGDASSAAAAAEGGKAVLFVPLSSGEMKALVEQIRSMEDVVHD